MRILPVATKVFGRFRSDAVRVVIPLLLFGISISGSECVTTNKSDPTGTGHESRIVVTLSGQYDEIARAYVNGEEIGTVTTGGSVSSKVLEPGTYTVELQTSRPLVVWPSHSTELKEGQNKTVAFSADPSTIRVTLDALCVGTINEAQVYVKGLNVGTINPGGIVTKQVAAGEEYTVELRQGTAVKASQKVKVDKYAATFSVNFNCD